MLQNPSKYHPNPLSHFLALHNSQAAHNAHPHALPSAASHTQFHQHHPTIMANHQHSHHLRSPHAHLIDAANTSLDVGKSFTIAAILGLQKSAIENNRKEYNNVINLSLNGSNGNHHSQNLTLTTNDMNNGENRLMPNNNSHHNNNTSNKTNASSDFSSVNNFNCDSNAAISSAALVNRYLPTASASSASSFVASASHQQQTLTSSHVRASTFAAAAAVAAAAAANHSNSVAPSALQSLQQLHQHHAQQTSLNFQREKLKSENHSKKSSLKNKRVRTIFTPEQLERLEAEFERQQYMVGPERLYLAHTLQLTEAQVKVWFQNRRIKWRKHHLEITQQRLALLRQSQLPSTSTAEATATGATTASSPCRDQGEEINHNEEMRQSGGSRQPSESDLSICNDSMDAESILDDTEI